MKHGLLVLAAALALAISVPAQAQYMYLDVNDPANPSAHDGVNTAADVLTATTTSVDVWLATNMSLNNPNDPNSGTTSATCPYGPEALTINSYQIILTAPNGGVTYGAWTDNMGFPIDVGNGQAGNDKVMGWASSSTLPPGTYKLGTLALSSTGGNAYLTFAVSTSATAGALTAFGSLCSGPPDFDNTMKYNGDWQSIGPTRTTIPVTATTWGKIKNLYSH